MASVRGPNLQKIGHYERTQNIRAMVFDLKGSKGSGVLIVTEMDSAGNYESAMLETEAGTFDLK